DHVLGALPVHRRRQGGRQGDLQGRRDDQRRARCTPRGQRGRRTSDQGQLNGGSEKGAGRRRPLHSSTGSQRRKERQMAAFVLVPPSPMNGMSDKEGRLGIFPGGATPTM